MAHQASIGQWLAANRQTFDLRISEFSWGKSLATPIYDFEVNLHLGGKLSQGRGTDTDEALAFEKACAEAIERLVCKRLSISTEGVALHSNEHSARQNALNEVLERFIFFWHVNNSTPFLAGPSAIDKSLVSWVKEIDPGYEISLRQMVFQAGTYATVCLLSKGASLFLGLACDEDISSSYKKSSLEALRNLAAFKVDPSSYANAVETNTDLWSGDSSYLKKIAPLLIPMNDVVALPPIKIFSAPLSTETVPELEGCPIFVERAWVERSES